MTPWHICDHYAVFLVNAGKAAIVGGLVLGVAMAIAAVVTGVVAAIRKQTGPKALAVAPDPVPVIDAIRAFIQAIVGGPTWLALFGGGILLMWMATYTTPSFCPH